MTSFVQGSFARLFDKFHHERDLLDKLNSISVTRGKTVLNYKPPERPANTSSGAAKH